MKNLILLLRPQQWVKNTFIFLPLFFHGDLANVQMLINAVIAFFCYSFAASSIYCFNDIYDVAADRKHPKKCKRPIASGAVSIPQAYGLMALMLFLSLNLAFWTLGNSSMQVIGVICFYYLMNIAYCVKLKQIALVDVFIIALCFFLVQFYILFAKHFVQKTAGSFREIFAEKTIQTLTGLHFRYFNFSHASFFLPIKCKNT